MARSPAANSYLRTRILTANPQELRLMLYEGAIRFCRQARAALEKQDLETSHQSLMRAQKIVLELSTSLNHQVDPDLCGKLAALYTFVYRRLLDANLQRAVEPLDEALKLLEYERQTWTMLMEKAAGGTAEDRTATPLDVTGAQQTAISSLSAEG